MEKIVDVTPELANKIEVLRYKTDPKLGFQRELDGARAGMIARAAKEGTFIPPIFVGQLPNERLVLIDGQHRLHAYRMHKFPLKAIVYPENSVKSAAEAFVASNANGVRVSLRFRLNVDPGPDGKWIRAMAEKYETMPATIYNLVIGIVNRNRFSAGGKRINSHARELAERVLAYWTKDKRWNDRAHLYSSIAVMKVVGNFAGESTNPEETMKFLNSLDWKKNTRLGAITGSSWVFQSKMMSYLTRAMKKAGKLHYIPESDAKKKDRASKSAYARRTA